MKNMAKNIINGKNEEEQNIAAKPYLGHMESGRRGFRFSLDKIDKKILLELSINARIPYTNIAKNLEISREQVTYRIERMKKQGLLTGTLTLINPNAYKGRIYEVYLRIKKLTGEEKMKTTAHLIAHPQTQWVASCGSAWDYALTFICKTLEELESALNDIKVQLGTNLTALLVHPVLYEKEVWRPYLTELFSQEEAHQRLTRWKGKDDGSYQKYFVQSKNELLALDENDSKILRALERDARKPLSVIAQETGISFDTIKKRIVELIQHDVLQGFIPVISAPLLGLQWELLFLNTDTLSPEKIRKLEMFFTVHPAIAYYARVFSPKTTYVISVMVEDSRHYNDILSDLRTQHADIINGFENVTIFESHKFTYVTSMN